MIISVAFCFCTCFFRLFSNITWNDPIKTQVRFPPFLPQIFGCFPSSFRVKLKSAGGSGDALYLNCQFHLSLGPPNPTHSDLCCFRNTSDTVLPQGLCTVFPACNTLPPSYLHNVPRHFPSLIPHILTECLLGASA